MKTSVSSLGAFLSYMSALGMVMACSQQGEQPGGSGGASQSGGIATTGVRIVGTNGRGVVYGDAK